MKRVKRNYELPEKTIDWLERIKKNSRLSLQLQVTVAVYAWTRMDRDERFRLVGECLAWLNNPAVTDEDEASNDSEGVAAALGRKAQDIAGRPPGRPRKKKGSG